jgi:two-component system capsular synthesis response regulator RcsB
VPVLSILLVDDHPVIREGLGDLIAATAGLTVWGTAESGDDALVQLKATATTRTFRGDGPSVVVTDVHMPPGMDGIALVAEVRSRWPALPCVVFSAQRSHAYAERARAAGASGYVDKGDLDELIAAVFRAGSGAA